MLQENINTKNARGKVWKIVYFEQAHGFAPPSLALKIYQITHLFGCPKAKRLL